MSVSPLFAVEAEELLIQGKAQEAINLVQEGLIEYPKYPSAFGILAKAYKMIGNDDDANEILESAVYTFPQSKTLKAILDPNSLKQPKEFNIDKAVEIRNRRFKIIDETPISTYFTDEISNNSDFELDNEPVEFESKFEVDEYYFDNEDDIVNAPTYINIKSLTNKKLNIVINSKNYNLIPFSKNIPEFFFSNSNNSLFKFIEFPDFELPLSIEVFKENLKNESQNNSFSLDDSIETFNTILANRDILDEEIIHKEINSNNKSNDLEYENINDSIPLENSLSKFDDFEIQKDEDLEQDFLNNELENIRQIESISSNQFQTNDEENEINSIEDILGIIADDSDFVSSVENNEDFNTTLNELENLLEEKKESKVADVFKEIIKSDVEPRMSLEKIGEELSEFASDEIEEITDLDDFATETLAEIYIEQGAYQDAIDIYNKLIAQTPENEDYYLKRIELLTLNL